MTTRVYCVRHGETDWNAGRRFQGQSDTSLNATGLAQAEAAAEWIAAQPHTISAIYTSDLQRCQQTAQPIAQRLGLKPVLAPPLREINCGDWEGLYLEEIKRIDPEGIRQWREAIDTFTIPGGEGILDVQKRVTQFYEATIPTHADQTIVLVSHGAALFALINTLAERDLGATWRIKEMRLLNASISIVDYDPYSRQNQLIGYNLTEHLLP